jgi:hypothetical protein
MVTQGTRGFRQVRASVRIKTLRLVFFGVLCFIGQRPLLPSFYVPRGVRSTRKDRVGYNHIRPGLYLYLPILQDLSNAYLLNCLSCGPPAS